MASKHMKKYISSLISKKCKPLTIKLSLHISENGPGKEDQIQLVCQGCISKKTSFIVGEIVWVSLYRNKIGLSPIIKKRTPI